MIKAGEYMCKHSTMHAVNTNSEGTLVHNDPLFCSIVQSGKSTYRSMHQESNELRTPVSTYIVWDDVSRCFH